MADLSVNYLGLRLKNPVIVGSSGLTKSVDKMLACENNGAGAVVMKSLFEEALVSSEFKLSDSIEDHPEAYDYKYANVALMYGPAEYCDLVKEAKEKLSIPVIASINCISEKWWPQYARQIENSGADALELNIYNTVYEETITSAEIDEKYLRIAEMVKDVVKIPVALKISRYNTALPNLAGELEERKINGLVLFNKFVEPDIDIKRLELKSVFAMSKPEELMASLRWIALLSGKFNMDFCATTGIQNSEDVVKILLAGGKAVQIASILYREGLSRIGIILSGLETWMNMMKFNSIEDFRGKLNFRNAKKPDNYLRAQFIEKIGEIE